ncbi:MAG: two-component system response regulator TorR [Betaproteobacteria bacterium HGW-Betaproteobacteria-13]|jgi:two-component system torCAD operon response regulator TorR|nr:MAG: two-component system response regulator TorR [Gammaproteobacteria bacterium HGW-Gammaproteobacteria-8]PKO82507.1 MAG: two-component system response regulator TorR [Betaproteobacteria bacterium HGW-Betaproteobacteria-13]
MTIDEPLAPQHHVIVVEDDEITRIKISAYFEKAGYRVSQAASAKDMRAVMAVDPADVVLLDINLPGEDGLSLTRELRHESNLGIVLVTGRTDAIDRVVGLEMGADDYVTKPFEPRELLARVKNLLWRMAAAHKTPSDEGSKGRVRFGACSFDIEGRNLTVRGEPVRLTRAEYEMLVSLASAPRQVLSRDRLLARISHRGDTPSDRTVDVLIKRLRQKIEADPKTPEHIVTVHGEGYLFSP